MIVKLIKSDGNNHQFYEYIDNDKIVGHENLISDKQLDNLYKYGKTPLALAAWESIPHARIKQELTRLIKLRFRDKAFNFKIEESIDEEKGTKLILIVKKVVIKYKVKGEHYEQ